MALDLRRSKSEQIRGIADGQAETSRGGGLFLSNQDRIKLSHASIENTMLANKEAAKEKGIDIEALTSTILAASEGQPLDTSISSQQESQANAKLLLQFLLAQQEAEQLEGTPNKSKAVAPESNPPQEAAGQLSDDEVNQLLRLLTKDGQKKPAGKEGSKASK